MTTWTHLIRFIAHEDHQIHIGQLVDTTRDVGLDTFEGKEVKAYKIMGTIFNGQVTKNELTVKQVNPPLNPSKVTNTYRHKTTAFVTSRSQRLQLHPLPRPQL